MKRYLALVAGLIFVLGFTAVAFAIHAEIPADTQAVVAKGTTQITLGGQIRIRGFYETNNTDFDDSKADNLSIYETTVRLDVHAKVTPNTEAKISLRDTKASGDDDFTWGSTGGDGRGIYRKGGNVGGYRDMQGLYFREAWILHKGSGLLGIPAGIKVGHMPLKLGYGLFYDHTKNGEDAIVLFMDPTKELHVGLVAVKFDEGQPRRNDDANGYVLLFNYKAAKDTNISGDVTYLDDQAASPGGLHFWNFGLRGNTKVSGFGLKADVELQTGKEKDPAGDVKYSGYAFLVGLDYKLDPLKLGLEYAYGSGDKPGTADKDEGFVTALDNKQNYSWIAEYRVPAGSGISQTGLNNTQYVKARVGADLTKALSGHLDFYWLRANKTSSGVSKSIGTEVDWYLKYNIDKNLFWFVEGGYLFAGDFYKQFTGGKDPDNPWAIRHGILLSF